MSVARVEGIHSWRVVLINKWKCYYKLQNVSVARVEEIHSWRVVHINKWKCYYKLQNVSVARVEGIHSWRVENVIISYKMCLSLGLKEYIVGELYI